MSGNDKAQTSIVHPQVNEYNDYRFFSQGTTKNENNKLNIKLEKWNQFFNPEFKVESS